VKRKSVALFGSIVLLVSILAAGAFATTLPPIHSEGEIKAKWEASKPTATGSIFDITPVTVGPDYSVGKVNQSYLNDALKHLNFARYLAGLNDDVTLGADDINYAQHGAVLLAAVDELTHHPSKPTDMSQEFYEIGDIGVGGSLSGAHSHVQLDGDIFNYLHDRGDLTKTLGHRRHQLQPELLTAGFGVAKIPMKELYYNVTYNSVDGDFHLITYPQAATWPTAGVFPNGWMPAGIIWSVSLSYQDYVVPLVDITITVKRLSDNHTWVLSQTNPGNFDGLGDFFEILQDTEITPDAYVGAVPIMFRPGGIDAYRGEYQVTITGLKLQEGQTPDTLTYTVNFFDLASPYYTAPSDSVPDPGEPVNPPVPPTPPTTPGTGSDGGGGGGCSAGGLSLFGLLAGAVLVVKKNRV
jgi:hypothetical protein